MKRERSKKDIFIKIDGTDLNKILVSKEETYGGNKLFKYFIGYNGNDDIRPLCIMLSQIIEFLNAYILNALKVIRQCLLILVTTNC